MRMRMCDCVLIGVLGGTNQIFTAGERVVGDLMGVLLWLVVGCVRRGEDGQSNERTLWCASPAWSIVLRILSFHTPIRQALIEMYPSIIT
jgi:hypothetical protein